jgi:transcriptional regulator with XRE-family HTH domain
MTPKQLKSLRLSKGDTQSQLAEAVDLRERMLRYYESGQRGRKLPKWLEYAVLYHYENNC